MNNKEKPKKKNKLLKILKYASIFIGAVVAVDVCTSGKVTKPVKKAGRDALSDLKEEAMKEYGKMGDHSRQKKEDIVGGREVEKIQPTYHKREDKRKHNNREFRNRNNDRRERSKNNNNK